MSSEVVFGIGLLTAFTVGASSVAVAFHLGARRRPTREEFEEQIEEMRSARTKDQRARATAEGAVAELRGQLENARAEVGRANDGRTAEARARGAAEHQRQVSVEQRNALNERYQELVRRYNELVGRYRSVHQTATALQGEARRAAELEGEVRAIRARLADLEQQPKTAQEQTPSPVTEPDAPPVAPATAAQDSETAARLRNELDRLGAELIEARRREEAAGQAARAAEELAREAARAAAQLQSENGVLTADLADARRAEEAAREQLTALTGRLEEERKRVTDAERSRGPFRAERDTLPAENDPVSENPTGPGVASGSAEVEPELLRSDAERTRAVAQPEQEQEPVSESVQPPPVVLVRESLLGPDRAIAIPDRDRVTGRVHIGFDYGTHSTKVILNFPRDNSRRLVVFLDERTDGYPPFASPSLVRVADGRTFFGARCLAVEGGELFRSLKMKLLPPSKPSPAGAHDARTDALVGLYLAWLFGRIRQSFQGVANLRLSLNVAAPMNHFGDALLENRYLRVVNAAWQLAFAEKTPAVTQGVRFADARVRVTELLARPLPPSSERLFSILPETFAPLVSLTLNPDSETGLYGMIDMGAGTTELSINSVNRFEQQAILCYEDQSISLGGDQFAALDQTSTARESGAEELTARLLRVWREVWFAGFMRNQHPAQKPLWNRLVVLLSGGGLRRPGLQNRIEREELHLNYGRDRQVRWHTPTALGYAEPLSSTSGDEADWTRTYLAVAHGLSLERPLWPELARPCETHTNDPLRQTEELYVSRYNQ